jgi:hypothetical protein
VTALLFALAASATDLVDAHAFALAPQSGDPLDPVSAIRPTVVEPGDWNSAAALQYARAPVVEVVDDVLDPVLDHLVALDVTAGLAAAPGVRMDVALPLFLSSTHGAGLGDVQVGATWSPAGHVAATAWLGAPTGREETWMGAPGWSGGVTAAGTVERGAFAATANLGVELQPQVDRTDLSGGAGLVSRLALGWRARQDLGASVEAWLRTPFASSRVAWTGSPGELLFSARHRRPGGTWWAAGVGAPFTRGVGAAQYRLVVSVGLAGGTR